MHTAFTEGVSVPEMLTMIGGEENQGIIKFPSLFQNFKNPSNLIVNK